MFIYTQARKDLAMLGRHFLKREGALIHYPRACVFQPVPAPNEIDAALD